MVRLPRCRLLALACAALLAGCASTVVDTQWRNVELPPNYLRGATVLVSCETGDDVLRRICEERVTADLRLRGATPVLPAPGSVPPPQPGVADAQYLPAAASSGAKAVLSVTLGASSASVSPGVMLSIGGFGFGRSSGGGSILGSKHGEKIESSKNAAGERTYKIAK